MKKLMVLFSAVAALFALACVAPADEDSGTSRADAGSTDSRVRTDANAPHDSGGGTWIASNYGKICTSDGQCPGGKCYTVFSSGSSASACFKSCTTDTDCSDFPYDVANVGCGQTQSGDGLCVHTSPQNGPCGNPLMSLCTSDTYARLCATDPESGEGSCVQGCDPANPTSTTCPDTLPSGTCGCQNNDGCSDTWMTLGTNGTGVCAPVTNTGATCGISTETLIITPCTGGLVCDGLSQSSPTGTCQAAPADGGSAG